jgi:ribonuclease D
MNLPAPEIIDNGPDLARLAVNLAREPLIAFDTESNSLYAYRERVCLIQVSTRTADYVIDPFGIDSLAPLGPILADPQIEKVFHAAEYDLMCMKRDYGFTFNNIFDTMFAARIIGRKHFGLGALIEEFFNLPVDKRYQRADWSARPLPQEQLQYAQQDTHYLPQIRDFLLAELTEKNRVAEAREIFEALTQVPAAEPHFDPDGYWRINGSQDFSRRQMAVFRELYLWRNTTAEQQDVPPFKVMGDAGLLALAQALPTSATEMFKIRELAAHQVRRYAADLLKAIDAGFEAPLPRRPERPRPPDPEIQARFDALHNWRKKRAAERGVESDIILSKESMWAMARNPPADLADLASVPGLGPFRRDEYGEQLLHVVATAQPPSPDPA